MQGPEWPLMDEHPETLPGVMKSPSGLAVPAVLMKAVEPYYGISVQALDAKGKRTVSLFAVTHPALEAVLKASISDWEFKPAFDADQAVEASVWTAIIVNPAGASPELKNATPRILTVSPVYAAKRMMGTRKGPLVVRVKLSIDAAGEVGEFKVLSKADEVFEGPINGSLLSWRFAPARLNGQAVAGELNLGVLVYERERSMGQLQPPKAIQQEKPAYPKRMAASGIKGLVLVSFVVLENGSVSEPVILRSNNPGFDEAAIEAILKWKFEPALLNGKPVKMKIGQEILFELRGGRESYVVEAQSAKEQQQLPEHLRYDVPPKPIGVVAPVYPYGLLSEGKKGKAKVLMMLNENGLAAATHVVSASQPEFGLALAAAFDAFAFEPAMREGAPTATLLNMEHEFRITDDAYEDRSLLRSLAKNSDKIVSVDKLDTPLKPLSQRPAVYPCKEDFEPVSGEAVIEFVIDDEGKVRLPRIVSATQPEFGYAAVQAVASWRFEPPQSGGKKVMTRVNIPIQFTPEKRKAGKAPAKS